MASRNAATGRFESPERPIPLHAPRGMWSGGDSALVPLGFARKMRNLAMRSGVMELRPQFTYDNLTGVRGFAVWYDNATAAQRLFASLNPAACHVKGSSGETWSATLGSPSGALDILDSVSYRGVLYFVTSDASRVPQGVFSYDGTTMAFVAYTSTQAMFRPRCVEALKERLCYAGVRFVISNRFNGATDYEYDASNWTKTAVTSTLITSGAQIVSRITPTHASVAYMAAAATGAGSVITGDDRITWTGAIRGVSPTYKMPMTAQFKYTLAWTTGETLAIGAIRVPTFANGYHYMVTVAGDTHAATEPVWPTSAGTVTDNTVTWTFVGSDVVSQSEFNVPTVSEYGFMPFSVSASIAAGSNTEVTPFLKFGTASIPTYTLAPVDFSLRDGLADGAPLKRNYGHQLTYGRMALPFVNLDAGTGTISPDLDDVIYMTEVAQPDYITGTRFTRVSEVPGPVTALKATHEKLAVFKRNARWVFAATESPSIPILPEGDVRKGDGALNAKCVGVDDNGDLLYIGHSEVYRWDVKNDPVKQCGDAMRGEIMNKSAATWCESQSAPANRALLAIDQRNREMWVYTQKGKLYCKDLDTGPGEGWTTHDVNGGYEICDMAYNPTTGNMYFAFTAAPAGTAGVARLDPTVAVAEDSISTSGTTDVVAEFLMRPIEPSLPGAEVLVRNLSMFHKVTASQSGQETRCDVSFDQGVSFERSLTFDIAPLSTGGFVAVDLPIYQTWSTVQAKLVHTGQGGASNFSVSRITADIEIVGSYYPKNSLTSGASTL